MKSRIELFKENSALGGYSIAVRDDWSFKIKRLHIDEVERLAYEKQFGNKLILESQFMEWWTSFRKNEKNIS